MTTDPREMTPADMAALGMTRESRGDAIRVYCVETCMCGSRVAVLECGSGNCPLWPFRMGTDPWREKREMNEDERAAAAERLRAARNAKEIQA